MYILLIFYHTKSFLDTCEIYIPGVLAGQYMKKIIFSLHQTK